MGPISDYVHADLAWTGDRLICYPCSWEKPRISYRYCFAFLKTTSTDFCSSNNT